MPTHKRPLFYLIPLLSLFLAACITKPHSGPTGNPDAPQWYQHQAAVKKLDIYQTRGAFAYLTDEKKVYARFFWQQFSPDHYRLLLLNPLGNTELELRAEPGKVQIINAQGKRYVSDNAEQMLHKLSGMNIPLNNLRQWMMGLPGNADSIVVDKQYLLRQVTYRQDGQDWVVDYQDYDQQTQPPLPNRLELTHGNQRIKLKMDNWTLP